LKCDHLRRINRSSLNLNKGENKERAPLLASNDSAAYAALRIG
jgi:hypothetical protein